MENDDTNEALETSANLGALAQAAAGIDDQESDFIPPTPGQEEKEAQEEQAALEGAIITAQVAVMVAEQTVVTLWPVLKYDDEQRIKAAEVLAPVIAKHNGEIPPWLAAYQEEIQAAGFFALVGFQSYLAVKAHKAANDESDQEQPEAEQVTG